MPWIYALTALAATLLGFLAGMLTIKRSARWCPVCGGTLRCPDCAERDGSASPADSAAAGRPV
jgi:hypothetical protein